MIAVELGSFWLLVDAGWVLVGEGWVIVGGVLKVEEGFVDLYLFIVSIFALQMGIPL